MSITIKEVQTKFSLYAKTSRREVSLMCILSRPGRAALAGENLAKFSDSLPSDRSIGSSAK